MKREVLDVFPASPSVGSTCHPPLIQEHHVRLPDGLAKVLNASSAHARGLKGRGMRVAMIDSGFYPHPFYQAHGYRVTPVPTKKEKNPHVDEYGHGTAQLASLFAVAPEAEVLGIKCMDRDPSLAIERALELKPHVLSCAWGFNIDHAGTKEVPRQYHRMMGLILEAVRKGVVVVAAGGNGQHAFPGSMPEVIAAGGVYYSPEGRFETSDISSRFESSFFPGRQVPDLCGVVGLRPYGRLLLVPVPPKAKLARRPGFATIAAGKSTPVNSDGWAMFSGTSAATAMVSGAAALMLQASPGLKPADIRRLLVESARPVKGGCRLLDVDAALRMVEPQ